LVYRREPAFFGDCCFSACDRAVATTLREIAPAHLALYQRHGVIIRAAVGFCEQWSECRRELLDLGEDLG
jgi:hypothetical protein